MSISLICKKFTCSHVHIYDDTDIPDVYANWPDEREKLRAERFTQPQFGEFGLNTKRLVENVDGIMAHARAKWGEAARHVVYCPEYALAHSRAP